MKPRFEYGDKVNYLEEDGQVFTGWVEDYFEDLDPDNNDKIVGYSYVFKRDSDNQMKVVSQIWLWGSGSMAITVDRLCAL